MSVVAAGVAGTGCEADTSVGEAAVIVVDAGRTVAVVSRALTGVNGGQWYDKAFGLWDPDQNAPNQDVVEKAKRSGIGLVRYPGGSSANLFDWKRAVGPQASRRPQVQGVDGGPVDSVYGPDEYMRFVREVGAEPQIMAPFVGSTPAGIADWVAYMNAPEGTKWGDARAKNGHPEPYGVRYWEIGNELHHRGDGRYWLSAEDDKALEQYAFGGTQRQVGQRVGTPFDHRPAASVGDGRPGQWFIVWFPPVVPGSQVVRVGGVTWHEIDDLSSAGVGDLVYAFEPSTGTIRFGDGRHGAIPGHGASITVDYDSGPHAGFVDYYAAMKKADPSIDVLATWAPTGPGRLGASMSFPRLMAERGRGADYDGMTIHPFIDFTRDLHVTGFPSRLAGHHYQMLGEAAAAAMVTDLRAEVRAYTRSDAYVAVTECGALFFGDHDDSIYPRYETAMSHALYMASQWVRFANIGLPWAAANVLISEKPGVSRAVLGSRPKFVYTAEAVVREQMRGIVEGGGDVVETSVRGDIPVRTRKTLLGSSYPALVTTATIDREGALNLMVVNRSPGDSARAKVVIGGFHHYGPVAVSVVSGPAFDSFNNVYHPHAVKIQKLPANTDGDSLTWTFDAHSVTILRFTSR